MFRRVIATAGILLAVLFSAAAFAQSQPGLARLAGAPGNVYGSHDGVATFGGAMPSDGQLASIRALGLQVQELSHLPLALLRGPRAAMVEAVSRGFAQDVYPNDRLQFHSAASNLAMRVNEVHATGVTGSGVVVAVIDSGIDASHPDLAQRVVHNMKMVEVGDPVGNIIIPTEQLPYNNSDTSSGHGTHVAGIIAADNTDGKVLGVAPGASLVGYGTGDAIFVFGALSSFNHILAMKDEWKIRVINNSWGSSFRLFDPGEPINQATKRAADAGLVVVFAAGNASTEMSINPYSVAPWVISVGNGTLNHQRNATSSGGLEFDNSVLATLPAGELKHLAFAGDRIGLYHPSVTAPGTNIVSTGARTGLAVACTNLECTASASGTSMASPHVAGVAALMLQKSPSLTWPQIKSVLQVTSSLMPHTADPTQVQPFWQVGYGYVNAKAAVDLVGRHRFKEKALTRMQLEADRRVLGDRDERVLSTDYWSYTAAPATVNGSDIRVFTVNVPATTQAIKALVSYPSLGYVGLNPFDYSITLADAAGTVVATSTPAANAGMSQLFVELAGAGYAYGNWTVTVRGELGAQDQDVLMGILVGVAVHQLEQQVRVSPAMPAFTPSGSTAFYFTPGAAGLLSSPEGCNLQAGTPDAGLSSTRPAGTCQSGGMGYALNYGAGVPASFTSAPLAAPLTVGGEMTLRFYLTDPVQPVWTTAQNPRLAIEVDAIDAAGELLLAVAAGEWTVCNGTPRVCNTGPSPVGGTYTMSIPPTTLPAGSRLSILLRESGAVSSASRTVYGGRSLTADFSDAGVTFTTGTMQ